MRRLLRAHPARSIVVALTLATSACESGGPVLRLRVADGSPSRGQQTLARHGCGGCHVIPGVPGARGRVGPSLAGFAERSFIAGGLPNAPATVVRWIRTPQQIRPGTVMPNLGVPERDARDIVAYLYTLSERRLGPPHLLSPELIPAH